jgi:hypothetical protein
MKMGQGVFMMGELSGSSVSSRRTNRVADLPSREGSRLATTGPGARRPRGFHATKVAILRPAKRRRGAVPGLHRRLRSATDVPSTGQIVFRDGRSIVL